MTHHQRPLRVYSAMTEIWKPAPGFEGWYEVSSEGRARRSKPGKSTKVGRILKLQIHQDGYVFVDFTANGKHKQLLISRLVCGAFHGPCPEGMNCNHIDGNKANNSTVNLEWTTFSENCKHKYEVLGYSLKKFHAANPWVGVQGPAHPRAKRYIVTTPDGVELTVVGLKKFCRDNKLNVGAMFQLATGSGHSKRHRGYRCRYVSC